MNCLLNRLPMILLLGALLSVPAWAQDAEEQAVMDELAEELTAADELEEAVEAEPEPEPEPEPEFDETGLDDQGFADEDDDFESSERIPTDQSIDFPTDI